MKANELCSKAARMGMAGALMALMTPATSMAATTVDEVGGSAGTRMTLQYIGSIDENDLSNPDNPWSDADESTKQKVLQGDADETGAPLVHYAVPTTMPMAFKSNGDLICASGNAYKIDNKSVIQLNMTDVELTPGDGYEINGIGTGTNATLTVKLNVGASTYNEASAILPKASNTLSSVVKVPTTDLALAFGGTLDSSVDARDFGTAREVGSLTWNISPTGTV